MDVITIEARPRKAGKAGARTARAEGFVPGVLYGHNFEPLTFQVHELALRPLVYTAEQHRVSLQLEGRAYDCILKDIDFNKVNDRPFHIDLQVLQANEPITLNVPVHFAGKPVGQIQHGGEVTYLIHQISITALPNDIPATIEIDVTKMNVGDAIHVGDLKVPGVTFNDPAETALIIVSGPRPAEEEAEAGVTLTDEDTVSTTEADSGELL